MPSWSFRKIRHRVLALFVVVGLVLTLVVLLATGILTRSLVANLVEDNARNLVQTQSNIIELWLEERVQELVQLANSSLLESLDWEAIEPHLQRRIAQSHDYFLIYFLAAPDGSYDTTSQREAGYIGDRDYFARVMAGETVVSEPIVSRSTNERIIVIATPIWNEDRTAVAALFGLSIDLVKMLAGVGELTREATNMPVFLVDSGGYFILHHNPDLIQNSRIQDVYAGWDDLKGLEHGSFGVSQNGLDYRVFFQRLLGISDWTVVVKVPTTFFTQPVRRLIGQLTLVSALGFVLVLWLGYWFSSTITNPIVELNRIFKRGAHGDLTVRAEIASADELGETSSSFNLMMNTIGTMTYYDPLTGLPNRRNFMDHLEKSLKEETTVILALIAIRDLSELKTLFGSQVTDGILIHLAEALKKVSDEDLVVGRIADAEFGLIIPSRSSGVLLTIDRLEDLLKEPLHVEAGANARIFGGISISERQGLDAELVYQQAQAALYEAERTSQEQLKLYNPNTHHAMVDRLRFQTEVHTAVIQEQFCVFYQPIIDLRTNTIIGKEALVRWRHPLRGLLTPGHFLEVAEENALIEDIGEFMLHEVCRQHQEWLTQGLQLGWVAINISPNHFRSPHFPALVQSVLRTYGEQATILRLEIVEDAMLSPTPEVLRNFEELKKMGVQVAIDDFGTAYSNLGYLVRYPVQTLKIDRAFIDQIDLDKRTQGLIRSMIGIGRNLSMAVVAEGVERESQLELLRDMDCDEAQGFLFSPPIPASEYVQVIGELSERLQRTRPPR